MLEIELMVVARLRYRLYESVPPAKVQKKNKTELEIMIPCFSFKFIPMSTLKVSVDSILERLERVPLKGKLEVLNRLVKMVTVEASTTKEEKSHLENLDDITTGLIKSPLSEEERIELSKTLFGAWSDMPDSAINDITSSRTASARVDELYEE